MILVMILAVLTVFSTTAVQPVQGDDQQKLGPLAEHLMKVYGQDWPHYAPWVHSEIKVADNVAAYSLRPIDLGYDLLPGVRARGALVAYVTKNNKLGLAFVNETGELFKLYEVYVASSPKYREGIDFDYVDITGQGTSNEKVILVAWGANKKLYLLRATLGAHRLHENVNFPTVTKASNVTEIDLPYNYEDVRQVKVLALNHKFIVLFTAKRLNKPTEEYGYDIFYALVDPDGTIRLGPKDLGFQHVITFQARILDKQRSLVGLAFMGCWRQSNAGVWFTTMKLEGNSLKMVDIVQVSDLDFRVPCVKRALLDFNYYKCPNTDYYWMLLVWNDCRPPHIIINRIMKELKTPSISYHSYNIWVIYGQFLKVYKDGKVEIYKNNGNDFSNFPVAYIVLIESNKQNIKFGEIDSVSVFPAPGVVNEAVREFFVVDTSINTISPSVSAWLCYSVYNEFETDKNTYGFDVLSVPVPVPEENEKFIIGTEVDAILHNEYVAYPVLNEVGSELIPKNNPSPESFIYLYDTIQFNELYATSKKIIVHRDQVDIKAVSISNGIIIEGFIDTNVGSKKESSLFVMPTLVMVGPVKDIYRDYDHDNVLNNLIYPLNPYTVLKFRPIRTEDHPGAQAESIYDFTHSGATKRKIYFEVVYTIDFRSKVPTGSFLVRIFGPTRSSRPYWSIPLSGYLVVKEGSKIVTKSENVEILNIKSNETKIQIEFLPPITYVLEEVSQLINNIIQSKTIDREYVRKTADDTLNKLNQLLDQGLLQSYSYGVPNELNKVQQELKELHDNIEKMSNNEIISKLNDIIKNLRKLMSGMYYVFVLYHPNGSVSKYPDIPSSILNDLRSEFNELSYTGVISWIPISIKCKVPMLTQVQPSENVVPSPSEKLIRKVSVVTPPSSSEEESYNTQQSELSSQQHSQQQQQQRRNEEQTGPQQSTRQSPTHRSVPLLPTFPYYNRGLSRPRSRRRS